jgi:hypothetical protein
MEDFIALLGSLHSVFDTLRVFDLLWAKLDIFPVGLKNHSGLFRTS